MLLAGGDNQRRSRAPGVVEHPQLPEQDGLRPAVEGAVVDGEKQHVLRLRGPEDGQPEQRAAREIEMRPPVEDAPAPDLRRPVGLRELGSAG